MAIIPIFFSDSVVAIGCRKNNGEISWKATGFVVGELNDERRYNLFLVSNKHVLDHGYKKIVVRFNVVGGVEAKDYDIELISDAGEKLFSVHPQAGVDVACLMINPHVLEKDVGDVNAFFLDKHALTREAMVENEVVEGSLVYSLGFPSGLVGLHSKSPLCRIGCISRIAESYGDEGYLIDIQNFPGGSGSPIINKLDNSFLKGTTNYNKTALIGILSAYIPYQDILVSQQTGENMQITRENSGIAIAYTVNAIKQTIEREFERVKSIEEKNNPGHDETAA